MSTYVNRIIEDLKRRKANEPEFVQAAEEVLITLAPVFDKHPEYEKEALLERLVEPERVIIFRVPWADDSGKIHVNTGYRVQFNGSLGPYKGGLRFHESVNLSVMKFLAFEQIFKNSLTTLPIGGGKGGSDFNPKGRSDLEVMRFCQSFMTELQRHIGHDLDVPAGDIGVGAREIGYLFGQYRRVKNQYEAGVLTGKSACFGGSLCRTEATGYGLIYFMREMFNANSRTFENKDVIISGSGNVAIYACQKALEYGANVVAMSDSNGCIYDKSGIVLHTVKNLKELSRQRIKEYLKEHPTAEYFENVPGQPAKVFDLKADIVLPCATQNEINLETAKKMVKNGIWAVGEGANMPCDNDAIAYFLANKVLLAPGKAANAGGVATSALEMSQNSMRYAWTFDEVNQKLDAIMVGIFNACAFSSNEHGLGSNYVAGANIAGFKKLANAMVIQGII